jgi:LruC domain-containing protein
MKRLLLLLITTAMLISACNRNNTDTPDPINDNNIDELAIADNFDYNTAKLIKFNIQALDMNNVPFEKVRIYIYDGPKLDGGKLLLSGATNSEGVFTTEQNLAAYHKTLFVNTNYIGLPHEVEVEIVNNKIEVILGGSPSNNKSFEEISPKSTNADITFLSTYNSYGVPNNLEPERDQISQNFLNDLNATFPEGSYLFNTHPQYFDPTAVQDLKVIKESDIWITFVHEGAGFRNTAAFYTYDLDNPPTSINDIDEIKVIFPNASRNGSGGGLYPGDKVKIGHFPANTGIGFVVIANAFRNQSVQQRNDFIYFSNPSFNPETENDKKQHTALVADDVRERYVIGFEDLHRQNKDVYRCDHDFNDLIIYATAEEFDDIDNEEIEEIDDSDPDTDGDGIPDNEDDYPNDPDRAFNNQFEGTLAYEDLWPEKGDYDFNDIVIDYDFNQITNSDNKIEKIEAIFTLKAYGAAYENGFAFQIPVEPQLIANVTGMNIQEDYITLTENNTEAGQSKAVVIVFDNCYNVLNYPGQGIGVNTTIGQPYVAPQTINIEVSFVEPASQVDIGPIPFNPFIISNMERGREIHLPDMRPTDLIDDALLGSGSDDSDETRDRYFKASNNLPWGINIVEGFDYPVEKVSIIEAHLKFAEWAESGGTSYPDWFKDLDGYRENENIYPIP